MLQAEKTNLTRLKNNEKFIEVLEKLTCNIELTEDEKLYILTIALIFLRHFDNNKKFTTYIEFSYYIILKYSVLYQDYKPLYDFSIEFGFFPIAKSILSNGLIENLSIKDILIDDEIDFFSYNNQFVQTLEQYDTKNHILEQNFNELSFVAPTSYGKSSTIIDLIQKYDRDDIKIGIIVPSKSLIIQTFNLLKKENIHKRLLLHDEMYNEDKSFIAIFTQERALRLLKNDEIHFDVMFIDEAHNIFKKDSRNILLSRLIKRNRERFREAKIIYLSPLIQDSNKLKIEDSQFISEQRIHFNVKEPEIFEYLKTGIVRQYNRFIDEFYNIGNNSNFFDYIKENSQKKNFIYLLKPRKIEELAIELAKKYVNINNNDIEDIINILNENVHEKFYITQLITKGIIYLHGNIPDIIKEYLEYKFKNISALRYVIANTVILEGINLPIDNMFILNVHGLSEKDLVNLIGRINRLDSIFTFNLNNLEKLLPKVHFINSEEYGSSNENKMKNAIVKLRSRIFKDKVKNPTLESFDFNELDKKIERAKKEEDRESAKKAKERIMQLVRNEEYLSIDAQNDEEKLKKYFIENGISSLYGELDSIVNTIQTRVNIIPNEQLWWSNLRLIDKVYYLFIYKLEELINDFEFERLKNKKARNYYHTFIEFSHSMKLKDRISKVFEHFQSISNDEKSEFYMGKTYGEFPKGSKKYEQGKLNVYVNLSKKDDEALINLAIVKLQIEDKFVNFTLNKFIEMMNDYNLISEEEYNLHIYGTKKPKNINLIKFGMNSNLISRLEEDNQLENIDFDIYGNLIYNEKFAIFLNKIDDFYKFQITKFISKGFDEDL